MSTYVHSHLVTGGTGLVGAAFILELLQTTRDNVVAVVRGGDATDVRARLHTALLMAANDFNRGELGGDIFARVCAVRGDITEQLCGVELSELPPVSHVWHCAASLRYEDAHAEEIHRLNVGGTQQVIELTRQLGAQLNYVSTCYVAGSRTGHQFEVLPSTPAVANNQYELSKIAAERLVADSGLPFRILRPSIVVGHAETGAVLTFSGYYGFASALLRFAQHVRDHHGDVLDQQPLAFRADPDSQLNLVPVDLVARNGVQVGLRGALGLVFSLSNGESPTMSQVVEVTFQWAGLPVPRLVTERSELTGIDLILDDAMEFYGRYFTHAKTFDQTNTAIIVGEENLRAPMTSVRLVELLQWWRNRIAADGRTSFPSKTAFAYQAGQTPDTGQAPHGVLVAQGATTVPAV
ncbi:SDR family oxidoreductase [Nocardia asteroides]|uniref:SDR family oxidoreductase n=1 Tax=Nocardia asteroides TaxID=1824 RepID=UPI0037C992B5